MKATIENAPTNLNSDSNDYSMLVAFNYILDDIVKANSEDELRVYATSIFCKQNRYFKFGFGSSHMWVHQKEVGSDNSIDEFKRILIVRF